jgi:hypothetical protein
MNHHPSKTLITLRLLLRLSIEDRHTFPHMHPCMYSAPSKLKSYTLAVGMYRASGAS